MKVLVISAHPDDETIGAGGTLLRHVAKGDKVYWCVITQQGYSPPLPRKILEKARQQIYEVQKAYDIREVFLFGLHTMKLNTMSHIEISSKIKKVVDQVHPDIVYTTPRCDINIDHRIVYECTLVACRPLPGFLVRQLLSYEICTTSRYGLLSNAGCFNPNIFIDISDYLDRKIEIMSIYQTELCKYPHPRSPEGIKLFAQERGLSVGLKATECFELIRQLD